MSFLRRLFGTEKCATEDLDVKVPDDRPLDNAMSRAKKDHANAVRQFVSEANKQRRDTEFARHVIKEVLDRADRVRAIPHDASVKE